MCIEHRSTLVLAAALSLALLSSGCGKDARTALPKQPPGPPEVAVVTVAPQRVELTTELPGRTSAFLVAEVRPQVGGIVQKRLFTEGSNVTAGQVLYEIDPSSYQAAYANAKAAQARAKAGYSNAVAGQANANAAHAKAKAALSSAKAALSNAVAGQARAKAAYSGAVAARDRAKTAQATVVAALSRAEANAVPLRLKAERFKELVAMNAVSRQDYDDASAAVRQAEAAIQGAEATVSGSKAEIEGAEAAIQSAEAALKGSAAEIESAEAAIEGAEAAVKGTLAGIEGAEAAVKGAEAEIEGADAALEAVRINLAHTRVTAPISGRIGKSSVTIGALVTANQAAPLATIQRLDTVYVDVTQSTAHLLRLKQSLARGELTSGGPSQAKVKLLLEDGSPYPLEGTLKFSDVTVDPSTGSVTLRTVFPNPKQVLLPGMYVRAILEEGVNDQAILVPQRGVTRNPAGNAQVMLVGAGEKVEPRVIRAERTVGDSWLVTDGLKAGDRVILEGIQKAKPGTPVRAVRFQPSAVSTQPLPTAGG
ncbi:MAG: efflux RND transporter periplasmic adaptor subunit [Deltaproteobacteria bacterium]|nr:efflux RND transporter periplasmic adaptor subunit [Deltaproteobacteria bacterium]